MRLIDPPLPSCKTYRLVSILGTTSGNSGVENSSPVHHVGMPTHQGACPSPRAYGAFPGTQQSCILSIILYFSWKTSKYVQLFNISLSISLFEGRGLRSK